MNNNIQTLVDKFIQRPSYLDKGAGYLSKIFHTDKKTIYKAKEKARSILFGNKEAHLQNIIAEQEEYINKKFNEKDGSVDGITSKRITTLQDLIDFCEIDTSTWEITSWECNKWEVGAKDINEELQIKPLFQVKAKLAKVKEVTIFQNEFKNFLSDYEPKIEVLFSYVGPKPVQEGLLILPKQDAHFNRMDVRGRNNIQERFKQNLEETKSIVQEAAGNFLLEKITYIVGSDQFNSEWNNLTTGGTPQENILPYQTAFKAICDHEVNIIEMLKLHSKNVEILFVPGNHDEYAGWHLINWLDCFYRDDIGIIITEGTVDITRRYERYGTTAIMYDHGAKCNAKDLAKLFPMEFRKEWSNCDQFYIFSGDKHHELSLDIEGIKYYRVPALTPTKSKWEAIKHNTPGEMQAFLIKKNKGLTNIYSRLLE